MVLAASLLTAGALGLVVYATSTSLPYLASSPTTDPSFGRLNACLTAALPSERLGFAVSPDARRAAAFGRGKLVLCEEQDGHPASRTLDLFGVRDAAFDFHGALWLATEPTGPDASGGHGAALWWVAQGEPVRIGDLSPIALAGHADGVVALEQTGRLVSLASPSEVTGHALLPSPPTEEVHLSTDASGTRVALVAGKGVFAYRAKDLLPLRAEGPCEAEYLWWSTEPAKAVVSCAPGASWALTLDVASGEREAAPARARIRSTLAPKARLYVQACEHLPCSAPAP